MHASAAQDDSQPTGLRALAIVPARLASTRLPRKMLLRDTGRYLFEHTALNVARAPSIERVVVATDSEQIASAAASVGIESLLTSPDLPSGTDRVHAAARLLEERGEGPWDVIVNVQGDEPELPPEDLETLIRAFAASEVEFATLYVPLADDEQAASPNVVKVVVDAHGDALYFSRSPIPSTSHAQDSSTHARKRHVGVYAFRPAALAAYCALERGALEVTESLEQLRWLEAGRSIRVLEATEKSIGIDTREDYALFVTRERERRERTTGTHTSP